jgi:small subunit ribosomal protein S8
MTNYPLGDFLIQVKNAAMAKNAEVAVGSTKLIKAVAEKLKKLEYLSEVYEKEGRIIVHLAFRKKQPVLMDLKLVSKPGLRVYMSADDLEKKRGPSILVLSTPKGIKSHMEAIKMRVGGEVLVKVW